MSEQDLTPAMQEIMAQMARMQTELDSLKQRAQTLPLFEEQAVNPAPPATITSTRRHTLKRLGLALLGGVTAATVTGYSVSEARVISRPNYGTSKIGAVVIPPGLGAPTGSPPNNFNYGLVASGNTTLMDLSYLPQHNTGVYGEGATGVYGRGGNFYGVWGTSEWVGILGQTNATVSGTYGVSGYSSYGGAGTAGVHGKGKNIGVYGEGDTGGVGVYGTPGPNREWGGYFEGDCGVAGSLVAASKPFRIDHPLDPENKYLHHVAIESPDMKNLYDGVVTLDEQGQATVEMPDWFEALNFDFRYQLTSIGVSMPNLFIAEEIKERKFKIAGGLPGQRVSWQVTGIRQDAWAKANRIKVEVDKNDTEKGLYLHPEAFGKPEKMSVNKQFRAS